MVTNMQKGSTKDKKISEDSKLIHLLFPAMIASFAFDRLRISPEVNLSLQRVLYIAIFVIMMILLLAKRRLRFPVSSPTLFLPLIFNGILVFSLPFALDFSISVAAVWSLIQLSFTGIGVGLFLYNFWNAQDLIFLAKTLCWVTILSSLTIITDYFGLTGFYKWYIPDWALPREMGILGEPNFAAGKLAIGLPFLLWALIESTGEKISRFVYAIGLGLVTFALLLTGSRMGIFMYALLILLIILNKPSKIIRPRAILGGTLLIVALIFLLRGPLNEVVEHLISRMNPLWEFLVTGQELQEMSAWKRLRALEVGMLIFRDYPLFGIGMGGYRIIAGDYELLLTGSYAHNTYLEVLTGTGLMGFISFTALLIYISKRLRELSRFPEIKRLYFYLNLSFLMLLVHLFFLSDWPNRYLWGLYLPLSIGLSRLNIHRVGRQGV